MKTPDQHDDLFSNPDGNPAASNEIRFRAEDVACESAPAQSAHAFGARLRAAREAKALVLADCGRTLKLPVRVLQRLEAGEFGNANEYVFVRGALNSYARLLGVPLFEVDNALRSLAQAEQPVLVPTGSALRAPWLQRYGAAATYVVLTAFVAVPLVWLGLRGGLDNQLTRIAPLDNAPVTSAPQQVASGKQAASAAAPASRQQSEPPLLASMTPFSAMQVEDAASPSSPQAAAPAPAASSGGHVLALNVRADSWVEVTDASGKTLQSGILHAGDQRTYRSAQPLNVTLGNADGVDVQSDGKPLSLAPYRHANVARFKVFDSGNG
ncbi:MAG: DUF4115 domain-containing protein [Rhodanobacteraceae bacterium]